jgi:hypothetical protein
VESSGDGSNTSIQEPAMSKHPYTQAAPDTTPSNVIPFPKLRKSGHIAPPGKKIRTAIRSRDDLSFTERDSNGCLINWYIQPGLRARHHSDGMEAGKAWFAKVIELARHAPDKALSALRWAYRAMDQHGHGEEEGFMTEFARAALAGILAHPDGCFPEIPEPEEAGDEIL